MRAKLYNAEDAACSIEIMRRQEVTSYVKHAYLSSSQPSESSASTSPLHRSDRVDPECRSRMVEWCFQVVDFCKYNRETVEIAMGYLDRFLATPQGKVELKDRRRFQLAAMTCLYTAIKVHEPEAMEPRMISNLSRGVYSPREIEDMELEIISSLQWRMHAPTAVSFVRLFVALYTESAMINQELSAIADLACYFTQLAVGDHSFVEVCSSTIALASLMNALELLGSLHPFKSFIQKAAETAQIDTLSQEFVMTRERLWDEIKKKHHDHQQCLIPQLKPVSKVFNRSTVVDGSPRGILSAR